MKIYKYEIDLKRMVLDTKDCMKIAIQAPAKILSVGIQNPHKISMWALVDPDIEKAIVRTIGIVGTGNHIAFSTEKGDNRFLGTVFDGPFVWHVFEVM